MGRKKDIRSQYGGYFGGTGGNAADTTAQIDAGGGEADAVREQMGLGAYAFGVGAAGTIAGGIASYKTGLAARAYNKMTGQDIILHGSNVKGIKTIEPKVAKGNVNQALVYGKSPGTQRQMELSINDVDFYAASRFAESKLGSRPSNYEGSVYVARVKKSEQSKFMQNAYYRSENPAKVVSEIPISGNLPYRYFKTDEETKNAIIAAYKKAGGKKLKKS